MTETWDPAEIGSGGRERGRARWPRWLPTIALTLAAAGVLWTHHSKTPLAVDMEWYAAQSLAMASGHLGVQQGTVLLPALYPVGVPLLAAVPQWILGRDLRHGVYAIWVTGVLAVLVTAWLTERTAGQWGALMAVATLVGSGMFRLSTKAILSVAPGALATALTMALYLRGDRRYRLFLAGLCASLAGVVRFALLTLPISLLLVEVVVGFRQARRWSRLTALAAGVASGGALLLVQNRLNFGGFLLTGYAAHGFDTSGWFSWRHLLHPTAGLLAEPWRLTRDIVGVGYSHTQAVVLAALLGLVWLWRCGRTRERHLAIVCVSVLGAQYLLLGLCYFRAPVYLAPTLPALAVLAGCGVGGFVTSRWRPLVAPVLAVLSWMPVAPQIQQPMDEAITRFDGILLLDRELESDAVLVGCREPGLVLNTIAMRGERAVHCLAPGAGGVSTPFDESPLWPEAMEALEALLREGRPVYLDREPFPRNEAWQRAAVRGILERFPGRDVGLGAVVRLELPGESRQGGGTGPTG